MNLFNRSIASCCLIICTSNARAVQMEPWYDGGNISCGTIVSGTAEGMPYDVGYRFDVLLSSQNITFSTCESTFNTVLHYYYFMNNDWYQADVLCDGIDYVDDNCRSCTSKQETWNLLLTTGKYYIAVDDWRVFGNGGEYKLSMICDSDPDYVTSTTMYTFTSDNPAATKTTQYIESTHYSAYTTNPSITTSAMDATAESTANITTITDTDNSSFSYALILQLSFTNYTSLNDTYSIIAVLNDTTQNMAMSNECYIAMDLAYDETKVNVTLIICEHKPTALLIAQFNQTVNNIISRNPNQIVLEIYLKSVVLFADIIPTINEYETSHTLNTMSTMHDIYKQSNTENNGETGYFWIAIGIISFLFCGLLIICICSAYKIEKQRKEAQLKESHVIKDLECENIEQIDKDMNMIDDKPTIEGHQGSIIEIQVQDDVIGNDDCTKDTVHIDGEPEGSETEEGETADVKIWLEEIGLGRYYSNFMLNGYESVSFIKEVKAKYELAEIEITDKDHQATIMEAINNLNTECLTILTLQ